MSLPKYSEYRDSGVSWLPTLPSHWDVCALKRVASFKSGDGITSEQITETGNFPVYGGNGLRGFTSTFTHEGCFALVGRQGALCGNVNYSRGKFWASEHAIVATPIEPVATKWLGELLRAMDLNQYSVSAAQPGLSVELISNIGIPYPPFSEQTAIAAFLDRETTKIDALISEQEKLIAVLAEKRRATISHAVTKGISPNAPMKDSTIRWLEEVPAHWDVIPLKYLVELRSGATPSKDKHDYWDGDVPWASAKDLKVEKLGSTMNCITQKAVDEGVASLIGPGAVLVVVRGMILARMFPVVETLVPMAINQDLKAVIPSNRLSASFLAWLLRGSASESLQRLDEAGHGTKALRMEAWTSMHLPIPPLAEQLEIASFLSEATAKLDVLGANAKRAIGLLKERRSALIAAAVTGQIDVRDVMSEAVAGNTEAIAA